MSAISGAVEQTRYNTLLSSLSEQAHLFRGKRVLDFGASSGLSMLALLQLGAEDVWGVEPDAGRVAGSELPTLLHVPDTRRLPFGPDSFDFVLANAVLEHIPQPRTEYIREMWRVLRPGGYLLVNETPNKYLPWEFHTTHGLPFINWLPREVAHRIAVKAGRFDAARTDWATSGWRGLGHWELVSQLPEAEVSQPICRARHRVFRFLGLPAHLLDPYPLWLIKKNGHSRMPRTDIGSA